MRNCPFLLELHQALALPVVEVFVYVCSRGISTFITLVQGIRQGDPPAFTLASEIDELLPTLAFRHVRRGER